MSIPNGARPFMDGGVLKVRNTANTGLEDVPVAAPTGASIVQAFPFAFDTADLLTGAVVFTPLVDTLILDAFFVIETAWDGTTPKGDIGTFSGAAGLFATTEFAPYDMTVLESDIADNTGVQNIQYPGGSLADTSVVKFLLAAGASLKVLVSQNGQAGGADPGAAQGTAVLYLTTVAA